MRVWEQEGSCKARQVEVRALIMLDALESLPVSERCAEIGSGRLSTTSGAISAMLLARPLLPRGSAKAALIKSDAKVDFPMITNFLVLRDDIFSAYSKDVVIGALMEHFRPGTVSVRAEPVTVR